MFEGGKWEEAGEEKAGNVEEMAAEGVGDKTEMFPEALRTI